VVALIGANAAGKTTTMRLIAGLKKPTSGGITFAGQRVDQLPTRRRVGLGIILVPEGRQVFVRSTVNENLIMGAYHRSDRNHIDGDLERAFAMFPRLAERRKQRAGSLSGGEQQMLAIGRGLMSDPEILIIDELSLGLAPVVVHQLFNTLKKLKAGGLTILLVEQNVHLAFALSDRAYVIAEGRLFMEGLPAELAAMPEIRQAYLGL
jgi:branched-chain amino acid transport system ATP-binding protein